MNAKISVFVICVEAIIYLSLCNLHDCTFNRKHHSETMNSHSLKLQAYESLVERGAQKFATIFLLAWELQIYKNK